MNPIVNRNEAAPDVKRKTSTACTHSRMLADEYTADNKKTGKLICKECGAIVSDPR